MRCVSLAIDDGPFLQAQSTRENVCIYTRMVGRNAQHISIRVNMCQWPFVISTEKKTQKGAKVCYVKKINLQSPFINVPSCP